jgi:hypothetical protein
MFGSKISVPTGLTMLLPFDSQIIIEKISKEVKDDQGIHIHFWICVSLCGVIAFISGYLWRSSANRQMDRSSINIVERIYRDRIIVSMGLRYYSKKEKVIPFNPSLFMSAHIYHFLFLP